MIYKAGLATWHAKMGDMGVYESEGHNRGGGTGVAVCVCICIQMD